MRWRTWLAGPADGAVRAVSQRDAIPAPLWQRADSLRPARLAVLFHGTVRPR
jgi:hypothetical protein